MKIKLTKTLVSLVTIMTFMSFMAGDFSYPDAGDEARQRLEKGSQVMKPGYLAFDDWKSGGVNDRMVRGKNEREEAMKNQIRPRNIVQAVVKGPRRGKEIAIVTPEGQPGFDIPPDEAPPDIQDFLNSRESRVVEYDYALSEGKYMVLWIEKDKDGKFSILLQLFTEKGETIGEANFLTEGKEIQEARIVGIVSLSEGKSIAVWNEKGLDSREQIVTRFFNSAGETIKEYSLIDGGTLSTVSMHCFITTLPQDKIAVVWGELKDGERRFSYTMEIFTQEGTKVDKRSIINASMIDNSEFVPYYGELIFSDGSTGIVWKVQERYAKYSYSIEMSTEFTEYASSRFIGSDFTYTINPQYVNNSKVASFIINTFKPDGSQTHINLAPDYKSTDGDINFGHVYVLPDGRIAIYWFETDQDAGLQWLGLQFFNKDGTAESEQFYIKDIPYKSYWTWQASVRQLADGRIAVVWNETDNSDKHRLTMRIYNDGGKQNPTEHILAEGKSDIYIGDVTELMKEAGDTLYVNWYDKEEKTDTYTSKIEIFDKYGKAITRQFILEEGIRDKEGYNGGSYPPVMLSDGRVAIISQEQTWPEGDSLSSGSITVRLFNEDQERAVAEHVYEGKNLNLVSIINAPGDENFALSWFESDSLTWKTSLSMQVFDANGVKVGNENLLSDNMAFGWGWEETPIIDNNNNKIISNNALGYTVLPNGKVMLMLAELDDSYNLAGQKIQTFDLTNGKKVGEITFDKRFSGSDAYMDSIIVHPNSKISIVWITFLEEDSCRRGLIVQTFNEIGEKESEHELSLTRGKTLGELSMGHVDVTVASDGTFYVDWSEMLDNAGDNSGKYYGKKRFDVDGKEITWVPSKGWAVPGTAGNGPTQQLNYVKTNRNKDANFRNEAFDSSPKTSFNKPNLSSPMIKPNLRTNFSDTEKPNKYFEKNLTTHLGKVPIRNLNITDLLINADIYKSLAERLKSRNIESVLVLRNTLDNPDEDEENTIDTAEDLKEDLEEENLAEPGLNQASDDFIRVVANVLLAQALPDLFTEQGMRDIRTLFDEFNTEKNELLELYRESIKPYYENIKDELIKNRAILEIKDILSPDMNNKDITDLGRKAVDSIITKVKAEDTKTQKEKALLKKEAELRAKYLNPSLTRLEENMRFLLQSYTHKLTLILEGTGLAKKS